MVKEIAPKKIVTVNAKALKKDKREPKTDRIDDKQTVGQTAIKIVAEQNKIAELKIKDEKFKEDNHATTNTDADNNDNKSKIVVERNKIVEIIKDELKTNAEIVVREIIGTEIIEIVALNSKDVSNAKELIVVGLIKIEIIEIED